MTELLIFIGISLFITSPSAFIILHLFFKNSFLVNIGLAILAVALYSSWVTYFVASEGLEHMAWGVPTTLTVGILTILRLRKDINVLQHLRDNLDEMSNLNIDIKFKQTFFNRKDEFGDISRAMQNMALKLKNIVAQIKSNSSDLKNAGEQLSSISQEVSERANEQASTTQEIAASMEQMLATIISNTENATDTGTITNKSAGDMEKGQTLMTETLKTVAEISQKILVISEIAEKTDMLSINAAIEAARAGESGKGFAVVAQEIRKLADKTTSASEEINKLSKAGNIRSQLTSKLLYKIIPENRRGAELVNDIVTASKEQQSSVENINNSIQQLTEITNQNSASSEEISATAQELSAQAERLEEAVSIFTLGDLE